MSAAKDADANGLEVESTPSDIVFWDCSEDPAVAVTTTADLTRARGQQRETPEPSVAPLLMLGSGTGDPSYAIYDLHVDHLGSTRLVTTEDGAVLSAHDFYPFGSGTTDHKGMSPTLLRARPRPPR